MSGQLNAAHLISNNTTSMSSEQITMAAIMAVIGIIAAFWALAFIVRIFLKVGNYIALHAGSFLAASLLFLYMVSGQIFDDPKQYAIKLLYILWVVFFALVIFTSRVLYRRWKYGERTKTQSVSNGAGGGAYDSHATYAPIKPTVTFKNVQGMAALKAQLMEAVNDNKAAKKNGILLTGDPGNGKTFIAEALAGELKWGFMPITVGDIQSKWIGQTTEQLQAVFKAASNNGPLILFFDECDSFLRSRDNMMSSNNAEDVKVVNTFLNNIVDLRKVKNVIAIAASNYPDQLDSAALRDGRFDLKITIPNPDKEARHGLLVNFTDGLTFEDSVLERLVRRWEGFSVARIRSVAEKITKNAKAQGRKSVSMKEAMAALREVQGSMGEMVPEETPTLRDGKLHFDSKQREKLLTLAMRMENIDEVERLGGQVPKGVLFFGPPGTGKTAVAKSLAKTSGWAFIATSGNKLLNNSEAFVDLLKKARDLRPCIIFIDEADDVLQNRSTNPHGTTVTNRILAEMDGVGQLHDVMFIAATNNPEKLDAAAIRGGRFGERYEFKIPEDDTVLTMVREWIRSKKDTAPFHEEFTPEAVAQVLSGQSPSDIKDKLQQAVNTGVGRIMSGEGVDKITLGDLSVAMGG